MNLCTDYTVPIGRLSRRPNLLETLAAAAHELT